MSGLDDGVAVFPVQSRGKEPWGGLRWRRESKPRADWGASWPPGTNVGIDCGKSGLVVLDEDEPGAVEQWLGYVPETFTVGTGKGRHFYFRAPAGVAIRNGVRVATGVDVRAAGGYVVGPGSVHESGAVYRGLADLEPAELPAEVAAMLSGPSSSAAGESADVIEVDFSKAPGPMLLPERIEQGHRSSTLFAYASSLVGRGMTETEGLVLLREAFARCDPPFTDETPEAMWRRVKGRYPSNAEAAFSRLVEDRYQWRKADRLAQQKVAEEEAEAASHPDAWAAESLVEAEQVPEASILEVGEGSGRFLVRVGDIVGIHGAYGSGKTPVCYLAVVEQVKSGNLAMIVDYEMGRSQAVALLRELGLTDDQIETGVYYVYAPPALTAASRGRLVDRVAAREEATGRRLTVTVIDSLTQSMAMVPGASDNDAQDVTAWADSMPKWLRDQFGSAVLVIDHSGRGDGPHPSGSHKKLEVSQYHLWCKKGATFSRERADDGYSTLVVVKDRSGSSVLNEAVAVLRTVRGGSFALLAPGALPEGAEHLVELPLDQMSDALAAEGEVMSRLEDAGTSGLLKNEVTGSGAAGTRLRKALERVEGKNLVRWESTGRGMGRRYWLVT